MNNLEEEKAVSNNHLRDKSSSLLLDSPEADADLIEVEGACRQKERIVYFR